MEQQKEGINEKMFESREQMLAMFMQNFMVVATLVKRSVDTGVIARLKEEDRVFLLEMRMNLLLAFTAECVVNFNMKPHMIQELRDKGSHDLVPLLAPAIRRRIDAGHNLETFDSLLKATISYQGALCSCVRELDEDARLPFVLDFWGEEGPDIFVQMHTYAETMTEHFIEKHISIVKSPPFVIKEYLEAAMKQLIEQTVMAEKQNSTTH